MTQSDNKSNVRKVPQMFHQQKKFLLFVADIAKLKKHPEKLSDDDWRIYWTFINAQFSRSLPRFEIFGDGARISIFVATEKFSLPQDRFFSFPIFFLPPAWCRIPCGFQETHKKISNLTRNEKSIFNLTTHKIEDRWWVDRENSQLCEIETVIKR